MTHQIDPDPSDIADGIRRLEELANADPLGRLHLEIVAAAARRREYVAAMAEARRARRVVIAYSVATCVAGVAIIALLAAGIPAALELLSR